MELKKIEYNEPESEKINSESSSLLQIVNDLIIDSDDMNAIAAEELRSIVTKKKALNEERVSITRPMDEAKKRIMDLFGKPIAILEKAESTLKEKMLAYNNQKQAEARAQQKIADLKAAEDRARIAKEAEEAKNAILEAAKKEQEELEKQAEEARATGNFAAAVTLEAQKENVLYQAQSEAAIMEAQQMTISAPAPIIPTKVKTEGVHAKSNYKAKVTDMTALVAYVNAHPEYIELLLPNESALNKLAKALKESMRVPGVSVYNDATIAARTKK